MVYVFDGRNGDEKIGKRLAWEDECGENVNGEIEGKVTGFGHVNVENF
jgi:hypothetical protein